MLVVCVVCCVRGMYVCVVLCVLCVYIDMCFIYVWCIRVCFVHIVRVVGGACFRAVTVIELKFIEREIELNFIERKKPKEATESKFIEREMP